jgi:uncharacterized protein (DUF302 family)
MYEFNITLSGSFNDVKETLLDVLMQEQLGIVSEVDVQATLKKKMDLSIPPYQILGACNPKLASQIIEDEPNAGVLLPCNIIVREEIPGKVVISFMDPVAVLGLSDSEVVNDVARVAREKLQKVVAKLAETQA